MVRRIAERLAESAAADARRDAKPADVPCPPSGAERAVNWHPDALERPPEGVRRVTGWAWAGDRAARGAIPAAAARRCPECGEWFDRAELPECPHGPDPSPEARKRALAYLGTLAEANGHKGPGDPQ
jgi:hypothetical protein